MLSTTFISVLFVNICVSELTTAFIVCVQFVTGSRYLTLRSLQSIGEQASVIGTVGADEVANH